jgi:phage repressor protein C with HTH and peptisase S24 domain
VNSHQRIWNAIDTIAQKAGLTPSGLAKAAGMDATAFNKSKRLDAQVRQHWPNVETIQKIVDATGTTWSGFTRLVEKAPPIDPPSD